MNSKKPKTGDGNVSATTGSKRKEPVVAETPVVLDHTLKKGAAPGTVEIDAYVVCDFKIVWSELCDIYEEVTSQEVLHQIATVVMPHLFCSATRTISDLACVTDENGEHTPLTLMIKDVEAHTGLGSSVAAVHAVFETHFEAPIAI
ncbi:hypothetical protein Ctob_013762 [Chrysochromulina tobinii]|uniref:Uncharacterized protein n=1 Tax=Chrysochromulina tobinii TaxID=1460289 RepID=A0A0M0K1V7_9EUKA|nr:hypothetical protein Ctob_013762 [Chrysochromulina tobinii]|eukprot:KOO32368.1 hypothetical protein Ctob_013762 [Chrysochromulina sp. CCMP291]